jgi:hypothetical protein
MSVTFEALGSGRLSDQDRGGEGTAAGLGEHLKTVHMDEVAQVALELLCVAGERSDPFGLFAGDADPRGLRASLSGNG